MHEALHRCPHSTRENPPVRPVWATLRRPVTAAPYSISAASTADAYPSRARTLLSVGLLAFLYLWVFPYHASLNNPNENARVYMTVAMVDDHTFAINRIEQTWGYTNDKAIRNGRLYSSKAPGTSYLGVPGYWLLTHITGRDSHPLTAAQVLAHHSPPLERTVVTYWLRLWSSVLPALIFAWFWHRFLGRNTRSPALREAVFFSTMVGSQMFAYSEMFASHSQNAFATMAALMCLATVRRHDYSARLVGAEPRWSPGLMLLAGLFGASATLFEYPAATGMLGVILLILATGAERRVGFAMLAIPLMVLSGKFAVDKKMPLALACAGGAAISYAFTLTPRALVRLAMAGIGAIPPTALVLFFHKRAFGDPFKPGYSYLENPEFRSTTNQGFFGATALSWEAATRLYLDPAIGLVAVTAIFLAALAGFGSYLSWQPPKGSKRMTRGLLILVTLFAVAKCVSAVLALKAGNWQGSAMEQASWVGWLVLALMALSSVSLPKPVRVDAGLGAAMLLVCVLLSELIGRMNNWRGGWTVGPRYLATLTPLVGLAALVGLDSMSRLGAGWKRAATVFAAGATLHAFLMSGIPSAWFPHVPTEFTSPLFELFIPIIRDGYAPRNAGWYLFHWDGMKGMFPFFAVVGVVSAMLLRGDEKRPVPLVAHAMGGLAVMLLLLAPFAAAAKYESMGVTRFVKSVWEPQPPAPIAPQPARPGAPVPDETNTAMRARAHRMAASGDQLGALELYRRAAAAQR